MDEENIDWQSHFAFTLGIALSLLYAQKVSTTNQDNIKVLLNMPGTKKIARDEPQRLLGAFYREFDISYEKEKT